MPDMDTDGLQIGYIYCIENLVNHKKYIGQTIVSVESRFAQHIHSANSGVDTYLYRAMRLYGITNFVAYEISREFAPTRRELQERLNECEVFYICELGTFNPNGYNMTLGGQAFATPSTRRVAAVSDDGEIVGIYSSIRNASKMCGISEKCIQHACQSKSHFSGGMFWYYDTGDMIVGDNIGEQNVGAHNWRGHKTYQGKRVRMLSKDGALIREFDSATEAAKQLNISQAHISKCCNGYRKSAGGFLWSFNY